MRLPNLAIYAYSAPGNQVVRAEGQSRSIG